MTHIRSVIAATLLLGLLAAPIAPAYADCNDGTAGNDTIVCDTTTESSDPNTDPAVDNNGVSGNGGTDTVIVEEGATVEDSQTSVSTIEIDAGSVTNNGIVEANGELGVGIETYSGNIFNNGQIIADGPGISTILGEVINNGNITSNQIAINGGGGNIINNGAVTSNDDEFGTGIFTGNGDVVNNGTVTTNAEQGFGIFTYSGDVTNNGSITANNDGGQGIFVDDSGGVTATITNNGTITTNGDPSISFEGTGIANYGSAEIINNGEIIANGIEGRGIFSVSEETVNNGAVIANGLGGVGINTAGNVLNNGQVIANGTDGVGIWTGNQDNIVTLGADSFTSGTLAAVDTGAGNDTVIVQGGETASVTRTMVCGDVSVGSITISSSSSATVSGLIDAGEGIDAFQYNFTGYSAPTASYDTVNFENTFTNVTILEAPSAGGATRLYDDGVILAFTAKNGNGIDLCSGPRGWRAGTIDFAALDSGQTTFAAGNDGWYVNVLRLGNGQYQAQVFDGTGVLQSDKFTFTH